MARKSIVHPNHTDIAVFDVILGMADEQIKASAVMQKHAVNSNLATNETVSEFLKSSEGSRFKTEVSRAVKYLVDEGKLASNGNGRGTYYTLNATTNDLVLADASSLPDGKYRVSGGPTVGQIVRAIFNSLEPGDKFAPKEIQDKAIQFFPHLTHNSFGQIFSNLFDAKELFATGNGRARKYWRGVDKLEGACDLPELSETSLIPGSEDNSDIFDEVFTG